MDQPIVVPQGSGLGPLIPAIVTHRHKILGKARLVYMQMTECSYFLTQFEMIGDDDGLWSPCKDSSIYVQQF